MRQIEISSVGQMHIACGDLFKKDARGQFSSFGNSKINNFVMWLQCNLPIGWGMDKQNSDYEKDTGN